MATEKGVVKAVAIAGSRVPGEWERDGMPGPALDPPDRLLRIDLNSHRNGLAGADANRRDGMRVVHIHPRRVKVPRRIADAREQCLEAHEVAFEFIAFRDQCLNHFGVGGTGCEFISKPP